MTHHWNDVHGDAGLLEGGILDRERPVGVPAVGPTDNGGDSLVHQAPRAPRLDEFRGERPVGMRVEIDESGNDVEPGCVDDARRRRIAQITHGLDSVTPDSEVEPQCRVTSPVDDEPVADKNVEGFLLGKDPRSGESQC